MTHAYTCLVQTDDYNEQNYSQKLLPSSRGVSESKYIPESQIIQVCEVNTWLREKQFVRVSGRHAFEIPLADREVFLVFIFGLWINFIIFTKHYKETTKPSKYVLKNIEQKEGCNTKFCDDWKYFPSIKT